MLGTSEAEWEYRGVLVKGFFFPRLQDYSGRGKFMPLPLKSKILETPGSLATDDIKMFLL